MRGEAWHGQHINRQQEAGSLLFWQGCCARSLAGTTWCWLTLDSLFIITKMALIVKVDLDGSQTHDELLSYFQENAPIRALECRINVPREELNEQHPLLTVLQSTSTLENVIFNGYLSNGKDCFDLFVDAASQNNSIRTVELCGINCSAFAVQKLMQRNIHLQFQLCRIIGQPLSRDDYTCNVEKLTFEFSHGYWSVIDFMSSFRSWPLLRRLEIWRTEHSLQLVEKIIREAPILQELTLNYLEFVDPAVLKSLATVACNGPNENLKWHLNFCDFYPKTIAAWEEIVTWDKAKSMRVAFKVDDNVDRNCRNCKVVQAIMSKSSCVGDLHVKCFVECSGNRGFDFDLKQGDPDFVQQVMEQAHSLPLGLWPYLYHLASCGGADMSYRLSRESVGYTRELWSCPPPKRQKSDWKSKRRLNLLLRKVISPWLWSERSGGGIFFMDEMRCRQIFATPRPDESLTRNKLCSLRNDELHLISFISIWTFYSVYVMHFCISLLGAPVLLTSLTWNPFDHHAWNSMSFHLAATGPFQMNMDLCHCTIPEFYDVHSNTSDTTAEYRWQLWRSNFRWNSIAHSPLAYMEEI